MMMLMAPLLFAAAADTTILNTSVLQVDRAGHTITVSETAGAEVRTRRLPVAPSARAALARVRVGSTVVLTLRGDTVVGITTQGAPTRRQPQQEIPQLPPNATAPTNRTVPQLPAGVDPPQARPIPQVPPSAVATPAPAVSPVSVAPTRPAVSPVAVRSPRSPGTPKPVVLPSSPPEN